jgi:hypothetical protein
MKSTVTRTWLDTLLDAFAKLLKVNITFVTPVCPSVRMEQLG